MKRKMLLPIISGLLVVFFALAGCSSGNSSADAGSKNGKIELKLTHAVPEDHASHLALSAFKEKLAEKSNGKIDLKIFPNGQLYASDREAVEATQLGNVDMTMVATPTMASFEPAFMVFDLPFLFDNRDEAHKALDGELGKKLNELLPSQKLVGLGYGENGFRQYLNNVRPIHKPSDFKGLKFRVIENKLYQDAFDEMGANSSPLAFGETYSALQQNTFDGMDSPVSLVYAMKFYEVQKYLTIGDQTYAPLITVINKEKLDSMPEDLKEILLAEAQKMSVHQRELAYQQDTEQLKKLKEAGMEVNKLSDKDKKKFKSHLQPIYDKYSGQIGKDYLDAAMAAAKE
ncbi:DctP family TRAP transporter solute-binding subunit [Pseudobacillus badius]|uniref:DctP family TRAP transporter solute-binding subunit n=1 Tax=Bacillus badius TaxID=1455 RepID=UPI001CBC7B22|nr:DctP family TRAP transporter solute-binding subunit [Bacillus badius]MED0667008.1 DctP family TRAP transporter solute-binding subunit [Bacillus badius]GLY10801.1 ABC transporter substrate-binding protein [Bacillus badius]